MTRVTFTTLNHPILCKSQVHVYAIRETSLKLHIKTILVCLFFSIVLQPVVQHPKIRVNHLVDINLETFYDKQNLY